MNIPYKTMIQIMSYSSLQEDQVHSHVDLCKTPPEHIPPISLVSSCQIT